MHTEHNIRAISKSLCSLGAHLGHLKVESYGGLSHYILGGRGLFMLIDLNKTIVLLKASLVFFERLVSHYGTAVFSYSDISHLSLQLTDYISRIIAIKNQSFSYGSGVPGCITNYRYVFLRLIESLFSGIRVQYVTTGTNFILAKSYTNSFYSYYKKLWLGFINSANMRINNASDLAIARDKFHSFFLHSKKAILNKYLTLAYSRSLSAFEYVRNYSGFYESEDRAELRSALSDIQTEDEEALTHGHRKLMRAQNMQRVKQPSLAKHKKLPSFVSMLLRVCYVLKNKEYNIRIDYPNARIDEDMLFRFLFDRLHVFGRAIIFFRCFKKTSHLPDCLVMVNPTNSTAELHDFIGVHLPIICVADTNSEISHITYPIPSNDDSVILFIFYLLLFLEAADTACCSRLICL